jgi:hypothetical protein
MLRHFIQQSVGPLARSSSATFRFFSSNSPLSATPASAVLDWAKFYESTSTPEALATVQKKRRRFFPKLSGESALVSSKRLTRTEMPRTVFTYPF